MRIPIFQQLTWIRADVDAVDHRQPGERGRHEGTRAPYRSAANPEQEHEKELGINEHVHTMWAYLGAFVRSGLRPVRVEYAQGPSELSQRNIAGKLLRLGRTPATLWALNAYPYGVASRFDPHLQRPREGDAKWAPALPREFRGPDRRAGSG